MGCASVALWGELRSFLEKKAGGQWESRSASERTGPWSGESLTEGRGCLISELEQKVLGEQTGGFSDQWPWRGRGTWDVVLLASA